MQFWVVNLLWALADGLASFEVVVSGCAVSLEPAGGNWFHFVCHIASHVLLCLNFPLSLRLLGGCVENVFLRRNSPELEFQLNLQGVVLCFVECSERQ